MLLLALVCAVISAAAVAAVVAWHRLVPAEAGPAHEKALYTGFMADVERRLAAGDIDADLAHEERIEAGRALLKAQDQVVAGPVRPMHGLIIGAATAGLSFALYMVIGHPQLPDQPYKQRLQAWTHLATSDPDSVPPEILAVVLRRGQNDADKARDPAYWLLLGRYDMIAGNSYLGMKDYKIALGLAPQDFPAWSELGEAMTLVAGGDSSGKDTQAAFAEALKRDPNDARAHYYLGRDDVAHGRYEGARGHFRTALDHMAPDNPTRPVLQKELKDVDAAEIADAAAKQRVAGMVASLAAQLTAAPENPDGWARLLRSYDVLGDAAGHDAAVARMQAQYRDRPQVAQAIMSKSKAAVGREGGA